MKIEVRESQIEDVFVNSPNLVKRILTLEDDPRLLVRQMITPSGRLDLLYVYQATLLLIELKIGGFNRGFLEQVLRYKNDLKQYQANGKLLKGDIQPYLLCTFASEHQSKTAFESGVTCVIYNPKDVLQYFYQNLKPVASFVDIKPIDIGIWNIHLIHDLIYLLDKTNSVSKLQSLVAGSSKTLYNKIRFARELRLIEWEPNKDVILLTNLGREYVKHKDSILPERLSDAQAELLKTLVVHDPFESAVILGIASIVEAAFTLAKNIYPVRMSQLIEYFSYHAGKYFDWQTKKAKYNATRMYSNYAVDLGLLAKSSDSVYLTPAGFSFTLKLQLQKSLKMIDSGTAFYSR